MLNKQLIIGRLGADPEIRYMKDGKPVVNMSIATSESWKDRNDEWQQRSEWHKVVGFGKMAEVCNKHLKKGSLVYLEGKTQTEEWEDRDGNKRQTKKVIMTAFPVFLEKKEKSGNNDDNKGQNRGGGYPKDMDDDYPF